MQTMLGGEQPPERENSIDERTLRIRQLNDEARQNLQGIVMTPGVQALGKFGLLRLLVQLRSFDQFALDNDPYGEHDFGTLEQAGNRFFWKIDYYNLTLDAGSDDPSDPNITRRVITLMRADEY